MRNVLVAVGDADNRQLLIDVLGSAGYPVLAVRDGRAAVRLALGGSVSAAVLDIALPRRSGLEVCRRLRAEPATSSVPVILLSASGEQRHVEAGYDAGADCCLVKPFSPLGLVAQLRRLQTARAASAAARDAASALHALTGSGLRLLPPVQRAAGTG